MKFWFQDASHFLIKQILDGTEDFLATVLSKFCPQMELKKIVKKIRFICCLGHLASGCAVMSIYQNGHNNTNEKASGEVISPDSLYIFIE